MLPGLVFLAATIGCGWEPAGVVLQGQGATTQGDKVPAPWKPPIPQDDGFDWIKLNTGEWLKGRLLAMQDDTLEFDSEKLNNLEFDWEDVAELRSPHLVEMFLVSTETVSGPITVTRDNVKVGGANARSFPRSELVSITPGGQNRWDYWSADVSLGLTLRKGNTDEIQYNALATLQRRTPITRFKLDYVGNLTRLEGQNNANNHRVGSEFDWWLSKRLFLVLPYAEYFTDEFQNIESRVTVSAGPAYYLIDQSKMRWNVNAGPAYQATRFASVQAGEADGREAPAFLVRTDFDWEATKRIDVSFEYQVQFTTVDLGQALHHVVTSLDVELTKKFDLKVSFIWDRVESPQTDDTGITPDPDDYRLVVGVEVGL